ncbi:MAG: dihydropteroate synthase [Gemmatimonadetes bacterium]|nr:dihydropteroate synthase [Gemmatimonadota bacterium]
MPRVIQSPGEFTIIGENIHTTRIVMRRGRRVTTLEDGSEAVTFTDEEGRPRCLVVPEHFRETQPYEDGQVKHFLIAVWKGMHGDPAEQAEGTAYIHFEARRQIAAGASFLDLNVDEVSHELEEQKAAMRWLVSTVQQVSTVPPSIDSSRTEIIAEGLAAYDGACGRPMVNSVALERMDVLDLVKEHRAHAVVSAASTAGMPRDAEERLRNVKEAMDRVASGGVPLADVHVDPLVFPVSVDSANGRRYLDAVAAVRAEFGREIHVTGGLSNVAYGLPNRRLINDTFCYLALEEGLDSGIVNPLETRPARVFALDAESRPVKLAMAVINGEDEFCMNYLAAFRAGELD